MDQYIKEITIKVRCMDMEYITGMITQFIKVIGEIINLMVKESIYGMMVVDILGTGKITSFMVMVKYSMKMEEHTRDSFKMT